MTKKIDTAYIVDDDSVYVFGLQKLISLRGLCKNVFVFQNGFEAVKHIESIAFANELLPDVILLDINMPVMDGWQFMDEFIKIEPSMGKKITIYMVSSSIEDDDLKRAKAISQITNYIVKPITLPQLTEIFGVTPAQLS